MPVNRIKSLEIDFSRFSSWTRLLSSVARVIEAVDIFKKRTKTYTDRIKLAEEICFRKSQAVSFAKELYALKRSLSIPKDSRIVNLDHFLDEQNVLRTKSRIFNFIDNEFSTKPVILDAKDVAVQLLI